MSCLAHDLRQNAKIIITEHGISPTLLLGSLPVSVSNEKDKQAGLSSALPRKQDVRQKHSQAIGASLGGRKEERTMNREIKIITQGLLAVIVTLLLAACASRPQPMGSSGTAWGIGAFRSNGERIYFTATSERGTAITYTSGPASSGWMMMGGRLACVSCHGPNGQGGKHSMGMMQVMDAKDIRWSALQSEFDAEKFRLAVTKGQDPDGTQLNTDMPRWNIGNDDLADMITYLKTLP